MISGSLLLYVFLNVNDFINKQYEDYLHSEENYKFNIYTERQLNADSPPLIETQEKALKDLLNDKFSIKIEYDIVAFNGISHFDGNREEVLDKYIIQYTTEVNEIFAEEEFIRTISEANENNTVDFEKIPFKISENKILFADEIQKINILEPINEQIHIIKIPLKYYYQYNTNRACNDLPPFFEYFANFAKVYDACGSVILFLFGRVVRNLLYDFFVYVYNIVVAIVNLGDYPCVLHTVGDLCQ